MDTEQLLGQVNQLVGGDPSSGGQGLFSGFSAWSLIGGLLFSGIGLVAFVYGKKNAEWKFMIIGVALMVYPYFIPSAVGVFVVGSILTAMLYVLAKL